MYPRGCAQASPGHITPKEIRTQRRRPGEFRRVFSWHYQSGHPAPSLNTVEKGLAIFSKAPFTRQQHKPTGLLSAPIACPLPISARSYLAKLFICFHFAKCAFPSTAACMPKQCKPNKQSLHALKSTFTSL